MTDLNISVAASSDDAEEFTSPSVPNLTNIDLDFYYGAMEFVGIRFLNVTIPPGATIDTAILRMTSSISKSGAAYQQNIYCQDIDDAPTFTTANGNISTRDRTTAFASWTPPTVTAESPYDTADFAAALQEVIDRGGWASGQDVAIIIVGAQVGSERRDGYSYDHGSNVPQLRITYTVPVGGYTLVF